MKVLLVNPPMVNGLPVFRGERCWRPYPYLPFPKRTSYVAGELLGLGIQVDMVDCQARKMNYEDVGKLVKEKGYDVVYITSGDGFVIHDMKTADAVKKHSPSTIVCMNDPLIASVYPEFILNKYPNVDFIIRGDPGYVFKRFIQN